MTTVKGPYAETSDKDTLYLLTAQYTDNKMTSCQLVIYQTRVRVKRGQPTIIKRLILMGIKCQFSRFADTFSDSDEKVGIMIPQTKAPELLETLAWNSFFMESVMSCHYVWNRFISKGFWKKPREQGDC